MEPHLQPITGETPSSSSAITQDGARLDIAASGQWEDDSSAPSSTCAFSTLMQPKTVDASSLPATESTKIQKSGHIYEPRIREVEHASFTPLLPLGGWQRRLPLFTRGLHSFLQQKGSRPTVTPSHGSDACSLFRSTARPSSASEVPAPQKASPFAIRSPAMSSCGTEALVPEALVPESPLGPHHFLIHFLRCSLGRA